MLSCFRMQEFVIQCSVFLAQLKLTDVGAFPARGWRQFSLETIMFGQAPLASMYENLYMHIHTHSLDTMMDTCSTGCVRTTSHSPLSQAGVTGWVSVRLRFSLPGETCKLFICSMTKDTHTKSVTVCACARTRQQSLGLRHSIKNVFHYNRGRRTCNSSNFPGREVDGNARTVASSHDPNGTQLKNRKNTEIRPFPPR